MIIEVCGKSIYAWWTHLVRKRFWLFTLNTVCSITQTLQERLKITSTNYYKIYSTLYHYFLPLNGWSIEQLAPATLHDHMDNVIKDRSEWAIACNIGVKYSDVSHWPSCTVPRMHSISRYILYLFKTCICINFHFPTM